MSWGCRPPVFILSNEDNVNEMADSCHCFIMAFNFQAQERLRKLRSRVQTLSDAVIPYAGFQLVAIIYIYKLLNFFL